MGGSATSFSEEKGLLDYCGLSCGLGQVLLCKLTWLSVFMDIKPLSSICFFVLFSPVGFRGNLSLLEILFLFSRGIKQMAVANSIPQLKYPSCRRTKGPLQIDISEKAD